MDTMETVGDAGGNTQPPRNRSVQRVCWCFTHNGYDPERLDTFADTLKTICTWYVFQEETGESGNKHLQGVLYLKKRARIEELKQIDPKIHWEATRSIGSSQAYCSATQKRTGELFTFGVKVEAEPIELEEPRGWQLSVMKLIKTKADGRIIKWYWEPNGRVGKSSLCKYLVVKHNALVVNGKSTDMFHALTRFPNRRKIIIVDCPRSMQDYINYGAIELIKGGLVFSGKYEGDMLVYNYPHIMVFANQPPDESKMSLDRWEIHRIRVDAGDNLLLPCGGVEELLSTP